MKGLVISGLIFLLVFLIGAPVQARLLIPLADLEITDFNEEVGLIWNGSEEIILLITSVVLSIQTISLK
ncbi:MAG: hypothetical protein ACOCQF_04075, partial [Halanaerobiaceae bacterium]